MRAEVVLHSFPAMVNGHFDLFRKGQFYFCWTRPSFHSQVNPLRIFCDLETFFKKFYFYQVQVLSFQKPAYEDQAN